MTHSVELDAKPKGDLKIPKYKCMGDRVLVQPDTVEERMASGLYLPPSVQQHKQKECAMGRIVCMGPGMLCKDGTRFPMPEGFGIGDHVLYYNHGALPVKLAEGDYVSLRDDFLLGVLEEGKYAS